MIRSERDYQEAVRRLDDDRAIAEQQRRALSELGLSPDEVERGMQPTLSFQAQLAEEVEWYERVRRGDIRPIASLTEVGRLLIALRIRSGLSQRELADRLDSSEAQVSRDERNEYRGVGVDRAQRILDALGAKITAGVQQQPCEELVAAG